MPTEVIAPPYWVEVDPDMPNFWNIRDGEPIGRASDLTKFQAEDCWCCPFCQGYICNPNTVTPDSCHGGCR